MSRIAFPRGLLVWTGLWAAFAAVHWTARHQPYWWDSLGYVFAHAVEIHDAHLMPILRRWDVGHPTFFFWLVAASMKVFGVGPLAGHVVAWGFAALLARSSYALARAAALGRAAAATVAAAAVTFPLAWAATRQVTADLALAALLLAAVAAWASRRRRAMIVFASLAALTKFTGFLIVPALVLAGLVAPPPPGSSRRREALLALAPLAALGLFLAVRWAVRGPGWMIGWRPMQEFVPVWRWADFRENWEPATRQLWGLARLTWPAAALGASLAALALRGLLRRRSAEVPRAVIGAAALGAVWAAAHLQLTALLPRFGLPLVPVVFLLLGWSLRRATGRDAAVVAVGAAFVLLHAALWRPSWEVGTPAVLRPVVTELGHNLEIDRRYEDGIELIRWAAAEVRRDAAAHGLADLPGVCAQWPVTAALADPRRGYVSAPFPVRDFPGWSQPVPATHPYVIAIAGVTRLPLAPADAPQPLRLLAERRLGPLTARVWSSTAGR